MMAVQIKWEAVTYQEKHNVVQKEEENPNTTHVQMFVIFIRF
jgi:hypothetical protein